MTKLTKEKVDLLVNGTRDERVYACARSFKLFAIYYFTKYFSYKSAPFHDQLFQDFEDLVYGRIKEGAWVIYREGAKTSIAKMGVVWLIARKLQIDTLRDAGEDVSHWGERLYVNVDSYDKTNAESILFDVVTELQTNQLLIQDFGQLYNQPRSQDQKSLKRISDFITTNTIRVEAHTALTSTRGRLFGNKRPDFILRDDIENEITSRSPAVTEKIISVLDGAKGGLAGHGVSLTLGNFIIEEGVIGYVMKAIRGSGGVVRFIPVVDHGGDIAWPDKHVATDEEAVEANRAITDPTRRKISLESKKRELNAGGRRVYEVEMLLDPVAAGSPFFDREKIDELMQNAKPPKEDKAGFFVWSDFNPSHKYAIGADTGKGNGGDHSTTCLIDFATTPNKQVGSYANNMMPADQFAYEMKREGLMYGECLLAPEKNTESGGSCLTTLKMIYPAEWIYRQVPTDRIKDVPLGSGELGWETNGATKYMILDALRTAVEDGQLVINDIRILKEMRSFSHSDADELGRARMGHSTRHFDLLMAAAIAWEMRKWARVHDPKPAAGDYKQPEYERPGYER